MLAILLRLRSSGELIVTQYEFTPPSRYPDRLIEAICDETTKADRFDDVCGIAARRRAFVLGDDPLAARTEEEEFGASIGFQPVKLLLMPGKPAWGRANKCAQRKSLDS